jgi:glyoxylase-like metal-dependent hydrolase (beta-lactamase superfamily II)
MRVIPLEGNRQRLDGGAMYGNAPKAMWARWSAPDEQNRITLACRAMLVDDGSRRVLCEAGIGSFFPPELRARYGVEGAPNQLVVSLAELGLSPDDIDVVVLSHLHFDHAGGLLSSYEEGARLLFRKARFVVGREAWARALAPHARDRASFVPELNRQLEDSDRLVLVDGNHCELMGEGWRFHRSDGHTPGLLLAEIEAEVATDRRGAAAAVPLVFAADLVPGIPWVNAAITMGYDRWPERLIDEKSALLADLAGRGGALFFTHDPDRAVARIVRDERGRFGAA